MNEAIPYSCFDKDLSFVGFLFYNEELWKCQISPLKDKFGTGGNFGWWDRVWKKKNENTITKLPPALLLEEQEETTTFSLSTSALSLREMRRGFSLKNEPLFMTSFWNPSSFVIIAKEDLFREQVRTLALWIKDLKIDLFQNERGIFLIKTGTQKGFKY